MGIWYRAGTVNVANGSATVTGILTAWLVYVRIGDRISFDGGGKWYEILAIVSNTEITLATNFAETTITGGIYAIDPSSYRHQVPSDIIEQMRLALAAATYLINTTGVPDAGIGANGSVALDIAAQSLYYKVSGAWLGPIALGLIDGDHGDIVVSDAGVTLTIEAGAVNTTKLGGDITSAGKALLDDADSAAQKTTLGLVPIASSGSAADLTSGLVPAARMPAHTGDVTSADGSVALTVANDAVTNAKAANMGSATVKANITGATADPADVALSAFKAALAITGADVANTPAGGVAATTVQAAINELDTEKYDKTGGTVTGNVTITGNLIVQGDTVTLDTSTVSVEDTVIEVGRNNVGAAAPYLGLKAKRNGTDAFWLWNESTDRWTAYISTDDMATAGTLADVHAANFFGALTGNASTATAWQTGRIIAIGNDATGSASVDGTANVTINITIANNAVTTGKIADANVTTAKIADSNVTTAKIADANVTSAKLASNLALSGYYELSEISVPPNPADDTARFYAKDVAGVTKVAFLDSAGNETVFGAGGSGAPGGAANAVQYNDGAGSFAGEAAFTYDPTTNTQTVDYQTLAGRTPTAPPADTVKLFARKAARMLPAFIGPSGLETAIQPHIGRNKIGYWNPHGNATTLPGVFGMSAPTAQGTVTARNVATTNIATRVRRLGYVSAATAASLCGHYSTVAQYTVGDGAGLGGFYFETTVVPSSAAAVAGGRMFIGFSTSVAAATNVDPAALTNAFGVAKLSTSQNLHIVYGGSVAQTPIDLGSNFPADSLSADAYDIVLFCPASSSDVYWQVRRLGTAFVAEGVITNSGATVLPPSSTLLAHRVWRTNNATAAAVAIDISNVYIETDY